MEALKGLLTALLWAVLLLAQHVVCFDVFDSNLWYLYLLALTFALAQLGLLHRQRKRRGLLTVCGAVYSALGVLKTFFTLILVFRGGWQLSLFCLLLDLAGAASCFRLAGTEKHIGDTKVDR